MTEQKKHFILREIHILLGVEDDPASLGLFRLTHKEAVALRERLRVALDMT